MTSFWLVARRLSGASRGSVALLVVLIAIVSGFVQFGAAAARRTETPFDRFVAWSDPATLSTGGAPDEEIGPIGERLDDVEALPSVADWSRSEAVDIGGVELTPGRRTYPPRLNVGAVGASSFGDERDRFKLLAGHIPARDSVHEVITDFPTAEGFDLAVGDEFTIVMKEQVSEDQFVETPWPVTLAGIVSVPDTFPTIAGYSFAVLVLPQGFVEQHPEWIDPWGASDRLWLRDGVTGVDGFASEMDAIGLGGVDLQVHAVNYEGARKVVDLQASGLWLAAAVAGITGAVVIGQLLARQRGRAARDLEIGRALGMRRRQALIGAAIGDGVVGLLGALLGVVISIALSPLAPFGLARKVEPDPGVRIDTIVSTVVSVATVVLVVGVGALCTLSLLRRSRAGLDLDAPPTSRVGSFLAEPLGTGWRIAFANRRAIAIALIPPVITVVALVVVATSLHNVAALPQHAERSGAGWDAFINIESPDGAGLADVVADAEHVLASQPDVAAAARGGWTGLVVNGTDVYTQVLEPVAGIEPSITGGRAPVGESEIALGRSVLERLGADVGDTVEIDLANYGGRTAKFDVVGEVIVASPLFLSLPPDGGALISDRAYERWVDDGPLAFLVSFRDGVTPQQGLDAVLSGFPGTGPFAFSRSERGDVLALDSMVALPWILVVVLGVLTIASLIQWTVSTSRRERHRAAVLRALGLTGGQVTLAFVAAAALVVGTSTVLGLTCGVAAANAAWDVIARWLIVVPHAEIPWLVCSAVITATLLVAVAFAAWSSRRHAGSPALQLRVE